MEMKCSMCNSVLSSSNLKFSCSHFLCNKCLSRRLLLKKFSPLSTTKAVEMDCTCNGKITIPYKVCLKDISGAELQKKKNKYCIKHKALSDSFCPICRLWLCEECISTFHSEYLNTHKLSSEDKIITSKCFYHRENRNELFCTTCNKLICQKCVSDTSNPENLHNNHNTYSLEEYHKKIKEKKKYLKKLDDCLRLIDSKEEEITKDFNNKCEESKKQIEDIIKTMEKLRDDYMSKYEQEIENLKNIFLIIRQSYKNFYKELDGDKIDLASFNFISKIQGELNNIIYNPLNFEHIENAYNSLNKINFNKYYNIKFDFRNLVYEKGETIELEEGITAVCPLKSLQKSFACGTSKGKIQIYTKEDDYEYTMKAEAKGNQNSVNVLLETLRPEKYIISATTNKSIRIYGIEISSKNNEKPSCNLSFKKELNNNGSILSIFQLGDGRLVSSTSDKEIKIWKLDNLSTRENVEKIIKDDVGFEACLTHGATLENDENNKQLISGGSKGRIKCWDIISGKLGTVIDLPCKGITYLLSIDNHKIAVGTLEGKIIIVDLFNGNGQLLDGRNGHKDKINCMCYSKSKEKLFSCSKDQNIKVWDLITFKCINTIYRPHSSIIYGVAICGSDLISCSNDKSIITYSTGEADNGEEEYDPDYDEENYDKFE